MNTPTYLNLINAVHILVVAPLLYAVGSGRLPQEYNQYLVYLAVIVLAYHLWRLVTRMQLVKKVKQISLTEGMSGEVSTCKAVHYIKMFDSSPGYSHPVLKVREGECVIWTNIGEVEHTVTSSESDNYTKHDGMFNSDYMKPGENFAVQFLEKGSYPYYCILHKGWMRGRVDVV